ncbi:MAG: nuclear transport factor 2 family protein [Caulobacteraceae bacterium]
MKAAVIGLLASLAAAGAASAASTPVGTVHAFVDAFDKGDIAAAAATQSPGVTIIDEVAPYVWKAPGAFQAWGGALMADAKVSGQSGNKVTLRHVIRADEHGNAAYVVMAATYSYSQKGAAVSEPARMVFALARSGGDWKITAWAWAGDPPKPR